MEALKDSYVHLFNSAVPRSWEYDHAGFLKCRTTVLRSCVLKYKASQLDTDSIPLELKGRESYRLYVPPDELADSVSLNSLDGRPITVDHHWENVFGTRSIGNIAGKPYYNDNTRMVHADILVTNPDVIDRIVADENDKMKLVEQSAGYMSKIDWTPGVAPDGEEYDGIQRNIVYNHIALVGEGKGRAGRSVRILNKRSCDMVESTDFTKLKIWGKSIRVFNADVDNLEKIVDEKDAQLGDLVDSKALDEALAKITEFESKISALEDEKAKYVGQIEELKAKLDDATNPQMLENEVSQVMQDREDAQKVYNSLGFDPADKKFSDAVAASRKLHGDKLYKHVVNSVRILNSKDALPEDENVQTVRGRFRALVDISEMGSTAKKTIGGADAMRLLNSNAEQSASAGKFKTPAERRAKFYAIQNG